MASPTALQYLDKAVGSLRQLGLLPAKAGDPTPIVALLNQISDLSPDKVTVIARTLDQMSVFNDVVREHISAITVGERYQTITNAFNSIRDDARGLVDQYADGKISTMEKLSNSWMKMTRGDIAHRFDKIKDTYIDVQKDTKEQMEKERLILEAYMDFRGALKQSEVLALDVLKTAEGKLEAAKVSMKAAADAVAAYAGTEPAERSTLELKRDEELRALQAEEKRYQIAKDLSDNITIGYNTSEVIMARLVQTTNAKERIYAQSVSFFGTNEVVLTALSAAFTSLFGLHESTQTLESMKKGIDESLGTLSDIGGKVQEAALRAGYGPTISAAAVKKLVDSVVSYQERSITIIAEMRKLATENSAQIRQDVEDGKKRLADLVQQGAAAALTVKTS
jgi:hypothetical protein